jgi:pilus assembly protein CpaE
MKTAINILITGHDEADAKMLQTLLNPLPRVKTSIQILNEADADFWANTNFTSDLLIHFPGANTEKELEDLSKIPVFKRPSAIIVCTHSIVSVQLVRLAMQAGACDFVMGPQLFDDTVASVRKVIEHNFYPNTREKSAITTAVVNVRGGAGASTLARSLGHAFATQEQMPTLLLDLDFQFSSQCLELNLSPAQGLVEALAAIESLDKIAMMGYVAKHSSGLSVLSASSKEIQLPGEVDPVRFNQLMELIQGCYEHVVCDLPRLIDPIFNLVMEKADYIIILLRQDISNLRDTQRMIEILTSDLGVPIGRIIPIINRYESNNAIKLADVKRTLELDSVTALPNDFKNVRTAANLGIPIAEYAPKSPVTLSVLKLAETLSGSRRTGNQGLFKKLLSSLLSELAER